MKKIKEYAQRYMLIIVSRYFSLHANALREDKTPVWYKIFLYRLFLKEKASIIEGLFYPDHGHSYPSNTLRFGYAKLNEFFDKHSCLISSELAVGILYLLEEWYYSSISMISNRKDMMDKCLSFIEGNSVLNRIGDDMLHQAFRENGYYEESDPDSILVSIALQAYRRAHNLQGMEECADIKQKFLGESYPDAMYEILSIYYETRSWQKIKIFIQEIKSWGGDEHYDTTYEYWSTLAKHCAFWDGFRTEQSAARRHLYEKELSLIGTPLPVPEIYHTAEEDDLPF